MVRIKICGITNLEDALSSIRSGCDALGFVFYKRSPRYLVPEKARQIIGKLPERVIKIGVFVNARKKTIRRIARLCRLDMLQLHGDESVSFCRGFSEYKLIKAFRVKGRIDLRDILSYNSYAYLFDSFAVSKFGGTGRKFDWRLMRDLKRINRPLFLSGGLNEKNVKRAIKAFKPDWVDASSSLEAAPGRKDREKVRKFIRAAKGK